MIEFSPDVRYTIITRSPVLHRTETWEVSRTLFHRRLGERSWYHPRLMSRRVALELVRRLSSEEIVQQRSVLSYDDDDREQSEGSLNARADAPYPGYEGTIGPGPGGYRNPHVYARDVHSGAGNCVCGATPNDTRLHPELVPGVPNHRYTGGRR